MSRALFGIIIGTSLLLSSAFAAQGDVPSNPNIFAALQNLQAGQAAQNTSLTSLQTTLTAIQNAITALAPVQSSVRTTPPLIHTGNTFECAVTNVSAAARSVRIEAISVPGAILLASQVVAVPPGDGSQIFVTQATSRTICRFTVLDGTRSDIRASAHVLGGSLGESSVALAAE